MWTAQFSSAETANVIADVHSGYGSGVGSAERLAATIAADFDLGPQPRVGHYGDAPPERRRLRPGQHHSAE